MLGLCWTCLPRSQVQQLLMFCRFPADRNSEVEYRSASRLGDSDFDINRKRIKAIRLELQKKGWASTGFA